MDSMDMPEIVSQNASNQETENIQVQESQNNKMIIYGVEENPSYIMSLLLGFQHYMTVVSATIAIPLIISTALCMEPDDPAKGKLVCSILFVSGISTLLQASFGIRLPIIQGGSYAYLIPSFTILATNFKKCSSINYDALTEEEKTQEWQIRAREIHGAIIIVSLLEIIVSSTGIIGFLTRRISPLSMTPTITLVGISLYETTSKNSKGSWAVAIATTLILLLFCTILKDIWIPFFAYSKRKGMHFRKYQMFRLFPILFGILLSWTLCAILTICGVFSEGYPARTDTKLSLVKRSPWIYFPYPYQFGAPTFSFSNALGMIPVVLVSLIKSVGDYYAYAKVSEADSPSKSAINRGITVEGIAGCLMGLFGTCSGTASYSSTIGTIRLTKVASRRVIQFCGLIMLLFGILGKFGAICATMPDPVLGGIFMIILPMISSVGLSNLQYVDLNSARNLLVLGISLFMGIMVPEYMKNDVEARINTGSKTVDQSLTSVLSSSIFIGAALGILLDNIIPGTDEERGITKWNQSHSDKFGEEGNIYNLPIGMKFIKRWNIFKKIPICPTYDQRKINA